MEQARYRFGADTPEGIYARQLARGGALDLEALVVEHPALEDDLRRVHETWTSLAEATGALAASASGSIAARLRARYGCDLGSGPALQAEPGSADSVAGERLRALEAHAPRESRYEVVDEVARGGMGAILRVWEPDLRRSLAMKVMLAGEASGSEAEDRARALSRFLEEAQVTGQLDHPGVLAVHELGLDPDGRVYFTMPLVKGEDLQRVLGRVRNGEDGWTVPRALRVLLKVCETMAYSHDKGVIHRDLKPANVMVGGFGEVYVMDWGLARVVRRERRKGDRRKGDTSVLHTDREELRGADGASPLMTMDGDVVGTPAYMPPEQAHGRVEDLDARSDVYAIGAILYHLLAGHAPYTIPGERLSNLDVWTKVVDGPPEPLAERAPDAPGELVAVAEKAMARDPAERYPSAEALADDLQAYLDGRVVKAYGGGALAELRKWIARNRGTAYSSAVAGLLLLAGLGAVALVQARAKRDLAAGNLRLREANAALQVARDDAQAAQALAERSAEEARRERDAAERVVDLLVDLFESPDPATSLGATLTAKELLDRGAVSVEALRAQDPAVAARLLEAIGRAYHALALYDDAEAPLAHALEDRETALGAAHPDTLQTARELARLWRSRGEYGPAGGELERVLAEERRLLGEDHRETLTTLGELARLRHLEGRLGEAEALGGDLLERAARTLEPDDEAALRWTSQLAVVLRDAGRYGEAESLLVVALEGRRRTLGVDHPETLRTAHDLAGLRLLQDRRDEARTLYEDVLERRERVLGPDHPQTLTTTSDLAYLHLRAGRLGEAEPLFARALDGYRDLLGDDHPYALTARNNLAAVYQMQGRHAEARPLLEEALELSTRVRGPDHPNTLGTAYSLGALHHAEGRLDEAAALYRRAWEGYGAARGDGHPNTLLMLQALVAVEEARGDLDAARALAEELVDLTPADDPSRPGRERVRDELRHATR